MQTGNDAIIGFNYPDNGGTVYLGPNSVGGWVYLEPQTDLINGNISYIVPPPPTGSYSFSDGIDPEEFGQSGVSLTTEVTVGLGIMIMTGTPITLGGTVIVEGTLLLGTGTAYIHEQLSPQEGTFDVRPVQVPQGLIIGAGTDYVVEVSSGSTTIQVLDGPVIFVDQYTNNSITLGTNQMLTLPTGILTGFSQQDLQTMVSTFDASLINQWWIIAPIATPITTTVTPTSPAITLPPTNALNSNSNFLSQPMFLALFLIIIIVIVAVLIAKIKQKRPHQIDESNRKSRKQKNTASMHETPKTNLQTTETTNTSSIKPDTKQPTATYCPNCGNQLLKTEGTCPFCSSELSQWYQNNKK